MTTVNNQTVKPSNNHLLFLTKKRSTKLVFNILNLFPISVKLTNW